MVNVVVNETMPVPPRIERGTLVRCGMYPDGIYLVVSVTRNGLVVDLINLATGYLLLSISSEHLTQCPAGTTVTLTQE